MPLTDLEGIWRSQGYGLVARVAANEVQIIERTTVSCLPTRHYSFDRFVREFDVRRRADGDAFEFAQDGTLSIVTFQRLKDDAFRQLCPNGLTRKSKDPSSNFEVFWHTFNEHYAFFKERNVDWDAVYREFAPRAKSLRRSKDLRRLIAQILRRFDDGHISLEIGRTDVDTGDSFLEKHLREECGNLSLRCDLQDYISEQSRRFKSIIETEYLKSSYHRALNNEMIWGQIHPSTGYVRIESLGDFANKRYPTSDDDIGAVQRAFDAILAELGRLPSMIIDIRLNSGGHDAVALAIASRFADRARVFGSKRAFEGGRLTAPTELTVAPSPRKRYEGQVTLLVSRETISAAEIFVLAMREFPTVTLVGEPTRGILSDNFYRHLPNGWEIGLSNEIYRTVDGDLFEAKGIPVDIPAPFFLLSDRKNRVDSAVDTALAHLHKPR